MEPLKSMNAENQRIQKCFDAGLNSTAFLLIGFSCFAHSDLLLNLGICLGLAALVISAGRVKSVRKRLLRFFPNTVLVIWIAVMVKSSEHSSSYAPILSAIGGLGLIWAVIKGFWHLKREDSEC